MRLDVDAEPAALDHAVVLEVGDHDLVDQVGRDREADADVAAARAVDRVLTPITSPLRLKVGPPELPRLIGASICRKSS